MLRVRPMALFALAALTLGSASARADEKQACLSAFEKAQQLRLEVKLRAAREQLLYCSRPECPLLVRQDCSQWVTEVTSSLPSVVIAGRDANGNDVINVRVWIDGTVAADQLDGKPIILDPGLHKFKYETVGTGPIEEQVLVREGERNRPLTVKFSALNAEKKNNGDHDTGIDETPEKSGPPILAYTILGLGVVGLGAALYFDLKANSDAQGLRQSCAPNCKQEAVDDVERKYTFAGVSLGVGIVGVGVGTVLLLTHRTGPAKTKASAWSLDVSPARGGAMTSLGLHF